MEQPFSWQIFDRMARTLEGLGYLVIVIGPLAGIVMVVMGGGVGRMTGIVVIIASFLIALYHISFSLLMTAMHDMIRQMQSGQPGADADKAK